MAVQITNELIRISRVPRRAWTQDLTDLAVQTLTARFRKPGGTQVLRPVQAQALAELGATRGLFGPIQVGAGKTLISLLAPFMVNARRPVLLTKAALLEKTRNDRIILSKQWSIAHHMRDISYEALGRKAQASELWSTKPDMIIADECHFLKNIKSAAVAKRVARYFQDFPETVFVALSGTMTKRSLRDFWHLMKWALPRDRRFLPAGWRELDEWAAATDEKVQARADGSVLVQVLGVSEQTGDEVRDARRAIYERMRDTQGVIISSQDAVGASIEWNRVPWKASQESAKWLKNLDEFWEAPDEWPLTTPIEFWTLSQQLALGFYYKWEPRPPMPWWEARKAWNKEGRKILERNKRNLDSWSQVSQAVDEGLYGPDIQAIHKAWKEIEPTFKPNKVPVWFCTEILDLIEGWSRTEPGLIWVQHSTAFGPALQARGIPYHGEMGLDAQGILVDHKDPEQGSIALSIPANMTGRNLQKWNRNLITCPMPGGDQWEQLIGRTHREGQNADSVSFDVLDLCEANTRSINQSFLDAQRIQDLHQPKLLLANKER